MVGQMNQSEERQQNIQRVIKTAQDLFVKNGVVNTSVNRIAQESGLSAMSLYRYFSTRENLVLEVWKDSLSVFYGVFMRKYEEHIADAKNGYEIFLRCMDTYIEIYAIHPEWFDYTREMFVSFAGQKAAERDAEGQKDRDFWEKFYNWIPMPALKAMQEGQEDGSIRADINVYGAYQLIHNVYTGVSITQNFTEDIHPNDLIRFTTDLLANYIRSDS